LAGEGPRSAFFVTMNTSSSPTLVFIHSN
jgi:hypothetical protein